MAGKNTAAFGIYQTQADVEYAVDALRAEGFRNTDVSVLFPENKGTKDFAVEKNTKAPEGTATGAATGGAIGGILGWLAGIGTLAIPGVGPLVAAGPIVAALTGVGVGGAVGGIAGALVGMGIPEYEAKRYEGRIKSGGILLSAHCDDSDWTRKAKEILAVAVVEFCRTVTEMRRLVSALRIFWEPQTCYLKSTVIREISCVPVFFKLCDKACEYQKGSPALRCISRSCESSNSDASSSATIK